MAVPLIITTPGITANSYCSLLEGGAYFDTHLYKDAWETADTETQTRALLLATRLLDEHMNWNGRKYTQQQSLRFPQSGHVDRDGYIVDCTTIPQDLKKGTAEFAGHLILSDRTVESDTKGFSKMRAGDLELTILPSDRAQVIPESVLSLVSYLGAPMTKRSNKLARC
jgi:hypothetical protein